MDNSNGVDVALSELTLCNITHDNPSSKVDREVSFSSELSEPTPHSWSTAAGLDAYIHDQATVDGGVPTLWHPANQTLNNDESHTLGCVHDHNVMACCYIP